MNAVMDALAAHSLMSKQALGSERVREDMKDVLLGPGQLYEALRSCAAEAEGYVGARPWGHEGINDGGDRARR
ncbi:MAG: hypothetical protein JWP35_708 [Caulobacter sp.]|nr:hypothetical protein [Caulobacter sp.]